MNDMRFDGYGYPDMNLITNMFMKDNSLSNDSNNKISNNSNMSMMQANDLATPYEGYIRGNLYNRLYEQYKNYKPQRLVPNNEQAELLLNVNQLSFAAHEIRLYLDVHPDDNRMINLYNDYQQKANEAVRTYEQNYGPILQNSLSNTNTFSWEAYSWPWEKEEM